MLRASRLAKVLTVACCTLCGGRVNVYVTADDLTLATDAQTKAAQACLKGSSMTIEDRADVRAQLEEAAAGNVLLEIMRESKSQSEMTDLLVSKLPPAVARTAVPLVMFFVTLATYMLICCWTALPCCKCCRCFQRQRKIAFGLKLVVLLLIGGMVMALVIVSSLSTRGYDKAVEGFDVTNCAAASMVNASLQGQADPHFLGLIPVLNIFNELEGSLQESSTFITDLRALLLDTKDITDAVKVATATLDMLAAMLADSRNTLPTGTLHECLACGPLATTLSQVSVSLSSGTAAALSAAREEVDQQLSGSSLTSIQNSMTSATAPLVELKQTIKSSFTPFVSDTLMEQLSEGLNSNGTIASVAMIGLAGVLALFAMWTTVMWICCEKSSNPENDDGKRHNKCVHRLACCTWCCGCYYIMLGFLLGGILLVVAVPLSSMCLIMEDITSSMLKDIAGAMELNISGAEGDMLGSMIDQCLRNSSSNPRLLDLITVEENGQQVTMYDKLVTQTKEQIATQFNQISSSIDTGGASISGSSEVTQLLQMLQDVPLDTMMFPLASYGWDSDSDYQAMLASSTTQEYITSSSSCGDSTVPTGYSLPEEGTTKKGITSLVNALNSGMTSSSYDYSPPSCAKDFACKTAAQIGAQEHAACVAAGNFMNLKQEMQTGNIFKCRRFEPAGLPCDVYAMAQTGSTWSDDCMNADGTFTSVTYDCSLAQFVTLIQDYHVRLANVFARVDSATGSVLTKIQVDLKALLDLHFLTQIDAIGNGVTCGFMGTSFQNVIDGLCYGGVWGVKAVSSSYAACAALTLSLVVLMYMVWRVSLDNVNSCSKVADVSHDPVVPLR
ncbi:unnamed protein product [Effrenium voratum]|nr:unnamed protein product [Effrenium voratum]